MSNPPDARDPLNRPARTVALLVLFVAAVFLSPTPSAGGEPPDVDARPPWTLIGRDDDARTGYALYQQEHPDSNIATYRLEAIVDSPPDVVATAATKFVADPEFRAPNTDKTVLRADEDSILVYSYIHIDAPFVSDRDVISLVERTYDPDSLTHRIAWRATDEGPPTKEGVVRLELSEGSWTFTPVEPGATRVVYTNRADSAGFLPVWLVRSQMQKTMVDGIAGLREAVERERADFGDRARYPVGR